MSSPMTWRARLLLTGILLLMLLLAACSERDTAERDARTLASEATSAARASAEAQERTATVSAVTPTESTEPATTATTATGAATATADPNGARLETITSKIVTANGLVVSVVGEVRNTGLGHATGVAVTAELLDASGAVVESKTAGPSGVYPDIAPDTKSAFLIYFDDVPADSVIDVAVTVDYQTQTGEPKAWLTPVLRVDQWDATRIVGGLENPYPHPLRYPRMLIATFDTTGVLINVYDLHSTADYQIAVGGEVPIDALMPEGTIAPTTWEVYAWAAEGV